MPAYIVTFDPTLPLGARNGIEAAAVFAASTADAKDLLQAKYADDLDISWENATATQITSTADLIGWTLRVRVMSPEHEEVVDVSVVGAGGDNTVDEIAALMVIALNATTPIAGAAYNSGTQVLKIAETTDNLGDHTTVVEWYAPGGFEKAMDAFVVSKVEDGLANAALTATFVADAYVIPALLTKHRTTG